MFLSQLIALASYAVSAISDPSSGDGTTVKTSQGTVKGSLVTPAVRQWLGIPYAADTSGANRWKAPQPPPTIPSGTAFSATSFGSACPQFIDPLVTAVLGLAGQPQEVPNQSENCLNLDVWSPAVSRKQGTAVLIWFYGGSMVFGNTAVPEYNGQNFVNNNDDITIVSVNYRLNIFNAPTAPQLQGGVGNFGLLDVDAAITWVHDNIAAFGGDPNRISLFGESAGATAIDAYAYSHLNDKIVKGLILESGAVLPDITPSNISTSDPKSPWNTIANAVGCGTTSDAAQFSCMQSQPFDALEKASVANEMGFEAVADGITYFSDYTSRSANGQFLKVPVLIGSNANEADLFVVAMLELEKLPVPINTTAFSDLQTATGFTCPTAQAANDRANNGVTTYRYHYDGVFPDISNRTDLRAYHSSEVPMVFGTFRSLPFPAPPTSNQLALSAYMQAAWVAFARDPSSGLKGKGFNWPHYDPNKPTLAELGSTSNPTGVHFSLPVALDGVCELAFESYGIVKQLLTALGFVLLG